VHCAEGIEADRDRQQAAAAPTSRGAVTAGGFRPAGLAGLNPTMFKKVTMLFILFKMPPIY
jgi:hypothetical protein